MISYNNLKRFYCIQIRTKDINYVHSAMISISNVIYCNAYNNNKDLNDIHAYHIYQNFVDLPISIFSEYPFHITHATHFIKLNNNDICTGHSCGSLMIWNQIDNNDNNDKNKYNDNNDKNKYNDDNDKNKYNDKKFKILHAVNSPVCSLIILPNGNICSSHYNDSINIWNTNGILLNVINDYNKYSSYSSHQSHIANLSNGTLVCASYTGIHIWE